MELFLQRVLDGAGNGAIYAAMALAIVLVFISTGTLNFALGAMGMFCVFFAWWLVEGSGWSLPLPLAVGAAILLGFLGGGALERIFIRPFSDSHDHLPIIIVTLGIWLALEPLAGVLFSHESETLPSIFPAGSVSAGGVYITYGQIGLLGSVAVIGLALYVVFQKTRVGLAMRASVDNSLSARLSGISHSRMMMLGWAMAGSLAASAGILIAPTTLVSTGMLNNTLLLGFAAAALGGFTSVVGALVGGLIMGLLESLAPAYVPFLGADLALLTAFTVLIGVLLFKPSGLFGTEEIERV